MYIHQFMDIYKLILFLSKVYLYENDCSNITNQKIFISVLLQTKASMMFGSVCNCKTIIL